MLRVTLTLCYCIVHAHVDVDGDEVYGSVVTYMYICEVNTNTYHLRFFFEKDRCVGNFKTMFTSLIYFLSVLDIYCLGFHLFSVYNTTDQM